MISTVSNNTLLLAPGLVGYWSLDEGSGTTTVDARGVNNDGTLMDMDPLTAWTTDVAPTGFANPYTLSFDGVNDRVQVLNDVAFDFGADQDFSIAFWFKTSTSSASAPEILKKQDARFSTRSASRTAAAKSVSNWTMAPTLRQASKPAPATWPMGSGIT